LTNYTTSDEARKHGVFCTGADGDLRLYLQKPSLDVQTRTGALDSQGRALLDLGVMSWDAETSARWLRVFHGELKEKILQHGLDLYREICCAMGTEATVEHYIQAVRSSGSTWDDATLREIFPALHDVPMHVSALPRCTFLHFGTTRQLVESGVSLIEYDGGTVPDNELLCVNVEMRTGGAVSGRNSWVESCCVSAPLELAGDNVVVGVEMDQPLALPERACLDVLPGTSRDGEPVFFVRCYGVGDAFKDSMFLGRPVGEWLTEVGAAPEGVWPDAGNGTLWDARMFPAVQTSGEYREWLWMFAPACASSEQKAAWLAADRYSAEEIGLLYKQQTIIS
jgi:hypothetical protein